jgi:hypothetical protein
MRGSDFTIRLRNTAKAYDNGGVIGDTLKKAADRIDELEKEKADCLLVIQSYSDLNRETTKQNVRLRSTLIAIQTKVQETLRPTTFQEEFFEQDRQLRSNIIRDWEC